MKYEEAKQEPEYDSDNQGMKAETFPREVTNETGSDEVVRITTDEVKDESDEVKPEDTKGEPKVEAENNVDQTQGEHFNNKFMKSNILKNIPLLILGIRLFKKTLQPPKFTPIQPPV
jgi:hypothetical protein